jgi:hypothetical protein
MIGFVNNETVSVYQQWSFNILYIPVGMNGKNTLYPYAVMGFRREKVLITET